MKSSFLALAAILPFAAVAQTSPSLQRAAPQKQPAKFQDVIAQQALGQVNLSPDGSFLLYEWGHPYLNWAPEASWLASNAARRMQTVIYRVDLTAQRPSSEYLFHPQAAASYWLKDISPDNVHVIFYELSHDLKSLRVGVWSFQAGAVQWFAPRPDEGRIETETGWISNVRAPDIPPKIRRKTAYTLVRGAHPNMSGFSDRETSPDAGGR